MTRKHFAFCAKSYSDYEFGTDNRKVNINEENKIIYPNLSSIKGFGEGVAETLYRLGNEKYNTFIDVITALLSNSISKTIVDKLIRINYFKKYGDINTLLSIMSYYDLLYGIKQISKEKAEKNNISLAVLKEYGHETEKQFNKVDSIGLLNYLISQIPFKELTLKETLDNQREILGIVNIVVPTINKRIYYVSELDVKKSIVNISLYEIYSGKTRTVKMWTSAYNRDPFSEGSILYITSLEKKNKKEPTGEVNPKTGKKIYKEVPDKFEYWLGKFVVKNDVEDGEEDDQ